MIQTCSLIRGLQSKERFIFIITHDYEFIATVCTDVIHIENGEVIEHYELDSLGCGKLRSFFENTTCKLMTKAGIYQDFVNIRRKSSGWSLISSRD